MQYESFVEKKIVNGHSTTRSSTVYFSFDYIPHRKIPVIRLVKRVGIILTMPAKIIVPRAQSIGIEGVLYSSRKNHINARVNIFAR